MIGFLLASNWVDLNLPVNPEICWRTCLALLHSVWQVFLLWLIVLTYGRQNQRSVHARFSLAFGCLLLAGCMPIANYVWCSHTSALPDSVAFASKQFAKHGSHSLFLPSDLNSEKESHWPTIKASPTVSLTTNQASRQDDGQTLISDHTDRLFAAENKKKNIQAGERNDIPIPSRTANGTSSIVIHRPTQTAVHPVDVANRFGTRPTFSPMVAEAESPNRSINWTLVAFSLLALGYLCGVALMLLRLGRSMNGQRRFFHQDNTLSVDNDRHSQLLQIARLAAASLGRKLNTRIAVFEGAGTAFVIGIFQPIVVINTSLVSGLSPDQLQQILAHELAHIYRWDPVSLLLQRVVEALLFFHPALWWISREVDQLRELCCDNLAATTTSPTEYADTLLTCYQLQAALGSDRPELALPVTPAQSSSLAQRINALLAQPVSTPTRHSHCSGGPATHRAFRERPLSLAVRFFLAVAFVIGCYTVLSHSPTAHALLMGQTDDSQTPEPSPWHFIDEISDGDLEPPQFWFSGARLELSDEIPRDLKIEAMVNAESCRFCQWRFGNTGSRRVLIMVEFEKRQPLRVFVDRNRDLQIDSSEEIDQRLHNDRVCVGRLPVQVVDGKRTIESERQIAIYPRFDRVRVRTLGYAEGQISINGRSLAYRRFDYDGDGIAVNRNDQVCLDLNQDGQFNAISERFNMRDHLLVAGTKYIARSDRLGHALTLEAQDQTGQLQLNFSPQDSTATLVQLEASLSDESGMLIRISNANVPVSIPVGRYRLESLFVQVQDAEQTTWRMELSADQPQPIAIAKDKLKTVPLLNEFHFSGLPQHDFDQYTGYFSHVRPTVHTANGLYISDFRRIENDPTPESRWEPNRLVSIQETGGSAVPEQQTCSGFG